MSVSQKELETTPIFAALTAEFGVEQLEQLVGGNAEQPEEGEEQAG
ncbi:hypothetical protein [Amycolatopsis sp.]|nr:hypothetical protein [Amycolatopsis sp.]HVV13264.1 hypothetical protein [Amycolatopsis sp.]